MSDDPCMAREGAGHGLRIERLLAVPREALWRCWTEAALLKPWFCPRPWYVSHAEIDPRPGGSSLVVMNGPDGEEMPHRGVYLEATPPAPGRVARLVFTDAYVRAWVPAEKPFMTGIITFEAVAEGTRYVAEALHWTEQDMAQHAAMGFEQGWGIVADQLGAFAATL
jgi:uncharacterized protein YndB with AHSA1/START domain